MHEEPNPDPAAPCIGQVYSFRTSPYSEFAPPETGRFAAFKIIGLAEKHITIGVLDGVWPTHPSANDLQFTALLKEHRFAHTGRLAVIGVNRDWWQPLELLDEVRFVGTQRLSSVERANADAVARFEVGTSFAGLRFVNYAAEGEWRWANDRDALVGEVDQKRAKDDALRRAKEDRYRQRLSKLTWEQLLSEVPFARWSPSPPFPSEAFTKAARDQILEACLALKALGPKPRKAEVRSILKKTVQWFNAEDEKADGCIETEEREDIFAILEEMAHVARQKSLVDEIDQWREW